MVQFSDGGIITEGSWNKSNFKFHAASQAIGVGTVIDTTATLVGSFQIMADEENNMVAGVLVTGSVGAKYTESYATIHHLAFSDISGHVQSTDAQTSAIWSGAVPLGSIYIPVENVVMKSGVSQYVGMYTKSSPGNMSAYLMGKVQVYGIGL